MKFKKAIEVKDVNKLISSIKELVPDRAKSTLSTGVNQEMLKFEDEYKELLKENEIKEQKMLEDSMKK